MREDQHLMAFKNVLANDIKKVFLNFEEFGEIHKINGQEVLLIIDENELTEREKRIYRGDGELYRKQLLFYVAAEDFGTLPSPGRILDLDGKKYLIREAANEDGIYSINLEVPRS